MSKYIKVHLKAQDDRPAGEYWEFADEDTIDGDVRVYKGFENAANAYIAKHGKPHGFNWSIDDIEAVSGHDGFEVVKDTQEWEKKVGQYMPMLIPIEARGSFSNGDTVFYYSEPGDYGSQSFLFASMEEAKAEVNDIYNSMNLEPEKEPSLDKNRIHFEGMNVTIWTTTILGGEGRSNTNHEDEDNYEDGMQDPGHPDEDYSEGMMDPGRDDEYDE